MPDTTRHDAWQAGGAYDAYMGRWSRQLAPRFLAWLAAAPGKDWLELGCGTGALSAAILAHAAPASLLAIDPSAGFIETARRNLADPRLRFTVGDAQALDEPAASRDLVVSALALNFMADRGKALAEMRRVLRPGGTMAFYVWDYPGGGVQFMRAFWSAAIALDPSARDLAEDRRFPFCTAEALLDAVAAAGFLAAECQAIEAPSVFADFDDYWRPFTLGAGPAPGYCTKLDPDARERLRASLAAALPREADGSIALTVRAWAIKARAP